MAISSRRRLSPQEQAERREFQRAAWEQRQCAVTFDPNDFKAGLRNWEAHHVVDASWLRMHGLPVWDWRNALRLRPDVHRKHTNRTEPVPLHCLLDINIAFAFEIMGPAADDWLRRRYSGDGDSRLQRAFAVAERKMEEEIAALPPGTLWVPPHMRRSPIYGQ